MRIHSLNYRDDARHNPGSAVVEFTGEETIALRNIIWKATKGEEGKSVSLGMAKTILLLDALVQHGGLDTADILAISNIDERLRYHQGGEENVEQ